MTLIDSIVSSLSKILHWLLCPPSVVRITNFVGCCEYNSLTIVEGKLTKLIEVFCLKQECVKWVLDIGLSASSHPLLQVLDSEEGEKTKAIILNNVLFVRSHE